MAGAALQLFPAGNPPGDDVAQFIDRDEGVAVGLVDDEGEGVVGHEGLLYAEAVALDDEAFLIGESTGDEGAADTVVKQEPQSRIFADIDGAWFGLDMDAGEGLELVLHDVLKGLVNRYMHFIGSPPVGRLPMVTTRGGQ